MSATHGSSLTYVGQTTVLLELGGARALTDPVSRDPVGPLRRDGPAVDAEWYRDRDAVRISHSHRDQLGPRSLRRVGRSTPLVVPTGIGRALERHGFRTVHRSASRQPRGGV